MLAAFNTATFVGPLLVTIKVALTAVNRLVIDGSMLAYYKPNTAVDINTDSMWAEVVMPTTLVDLVLVCVLLLVNVLVFFLGFLFLPALVINTVRNFLSVRDVMFYEYNRLINY